LGDPVRFAPWVSAEAQAVCAYESAAAAPPSQDLATLRRHYDAFNRRHLAVALDRYAVEIVRDVIGGVAVDIVTPREGVTDARTLLCLHGGAFMWGRGPGALLEAVPVAATARMRVIAIEYALAPEQVFPAAVDDVVAVYDAVTADRRPSSVGLYGCSAGGILTAQATARLIADGSPPPGAVAMLCGTGLDMLGDAPASATALAGGPLGAEPRDLTQLPYFTGAEVADPLVFPGDHDAVLARFPPSLLVTGSRDFAAGSVTVMHRRLLAAGTEAELLYFDGMGHAFHMATTIPESRETFAALARFFAANLR
jgi:epsilon-lactone hydrolase